MGLSQHAYGRHRKERGLPGGTQAAVSKAVQAQRISTLPDGTIDPVIADREWEANTSDSMRRQKPPAPAPQIPPPPAPADLAPAIASLAVEQPALGFEPPSEEPSKSDIEKSLLIEKRIKLKRENDAADGELVRVAEVQNEVSELITNAQNRLLLLPARVADRLAATKDPAEVASILEKELRDTMEEQSRYRVTSTAASAVVAAMVATLALVWTPPSEIPVSQWAEENRYLSAEVAAEGGRRWSSFAFQREPMDMVSHPAIRRVVLKSATQLLKSSTIENATAYTMAKSPGPIMIVLPRKEDAMEFSEDRIAPMIEETPVLRRIAKVTRSGRAPKRYHGGRLTITSAGSPANLAKRAVKLLCWDEADLMPVTVGEAGGPLGLGRQRLASYRNRAREIVASSPTIENSLIDREYALSDQREFYVPCPHCEVKQSLMKKWHRVRWQESRKREDGTVEMLSRQEQADSARYFCEACEQPWDNGHRLQAVDRGEWRAHAPFNGIAGFWISELYSPFKTLSQIVLNHLESKGSFEDEQRFKNTSLAENWEGRGEAPQWEILVRQREQYPVGIAPRDVLIVTAGADVHPDRIEIEVVGRGRRHQRWSIAYEIFHGNTAELVGSNGQRSPWERLSAFIGEMIPHERGGWLEIAQLFIDSSNQTNDVYQWARLHQGDGVRLPWGQLAPKVRAIKGRNGASEPVKQGKPQDVTCFGRPIKFGVSMQIVDVSFFKRRLYSRLQLQPPTEEQLQEGMDYPEGYCHFPEGANYGDEHFRQLCAERLDVLRDKRGFPSGEEWVKTRARNEALDCANYADAAAWQVGVDKWTEFHWRKLEAQLGPQQDGFELKAEIAPPMPVSTGQVQDSTAASDAVAALPRPSAPSRPAVISRPRRVFRVVGRIAV